MAPRKRARGSHAVATPTATRDDDVMDVDTPPAVAGDNADNASDTQKPDNNYNELWTDDQVASLFKGVIRWKPAGMHKHFRMIAISEHLRNHGFDPDLYQHTRIPFIWQKLRSYYNLEVIDERENFDEDETEDRYVEFTLPRKQFFDLMIARAPADPSEAPTSPPQLDLSPPPSPPKKRKRGDTVSKARGASVEDTEEGTDAPSPPPKGKKAAVGRKRAASRAKTAEKQERAETTEEDEAEDEEESSSSSEGEDSNEDRGTPVSRTTRKSKGRQAAAAAAAATTPAASTPTASTPAASRTRARGRRNRR
ncbi:chromatin modification-related protein EAF7-domain-containing protein [Mariannaea sp. PMI_226]|nr:chromatin modification-related protein EAF7-domain-containing protein [Mariannaea sp. PMI_226]